MVSHQTIGEDEPFRFAAGLTQRLYKVLPVGVIVENQFPQVAAIHHVVNRSRVLDAQWAWHRATLLS